MTAVSALASRVVDNREICPGHFALVLSAERLPASAAGQFVHVLCADDESAGPIVQSWSDGDRPALTRAFARSPAFLRRPFSIADRRPSEECDEILLIHHAVGPGTRWLADRRPGDHVNLSGPFGRGFSIPAEPGRVLLVGGGVGIPPLLYLARFLHERDVQTAAVFGARDATHFALDLIPEQITADRPTVCVRYPSQACTPTLLTTDDGTLGLRGRVTDGLAGLLKDSTWRASHVCACGPEPMLRAVASVTRAAGASCSLCIERMMGCGLGTCLSCVVRVGDDSRDCGWRYALTCQEGPVFERDRLVDYANA